MLERIITASALILVLLAARKLLWKTLSRRVQYTLWGLVLLRLLIPWNLPAMRFSVLTAARPVQQAVEQRLTDSSAVFPVGRFHLQQKVPGGGRNLPEAAAPARELWPSSCWPPICDLR